MYRIAMLAAVVGSLLLVAGASAQAQTDEPGDSGSVTIVEVGTDRPITEGDSTTVFTLDLPDAASCPGDSRNDGYRYNSFLVPAGTAIGELVYDNIGPAQGNPYLPLRDARLRPFVHNLLAPNPGPGLPGLIPPDHQLTFGGWPEPGLTPDRYTVGIACTEPSAWRVVQFWDLEGYVEIESDPDSETWGVNWRVVETDGTAVVAGEGNGAVSAVLLVVAGVAVLSGLVFLRRGRSTSTASYTERQPS